MVSLHFRKEELFSNLARFKYLGVILTKDGRLKAASDQMASTFMGTIQRVRKAGSHFFFFWWGLLHGPQQGPDRMKEKTYKTGKRKTPA